MVEALHYHMYQHVVLVNSGEFGSSYAMAPYKEHHENLLPIVKVRIRLVSTPLK